MTEVAPGLRLRPAGFDDDAEMRALNGVAFAANPKERADITRWQWWDNPFGPTLAWVWEDDGRIVAQYVAYAVPGRLAGQDATLTIGVDAAIAPSHQGRRLFTPLSEALYADAVARDLPLIAYPNEQSVRGISRAGWQEVATLGVHVLPLDDRWLAGRVHLPRPVVAVARRLALRAPAPRRAMRTEVIESVPEGVDDLWARSALPDGSGIARHGAWWRWRYDQHPDQPYRYITASDASGQLRGIAAVRTREDLGGRFHCLLELLVDGPDAARSIVRSVADGALGPADGIALTAVPGSPLAGYATTAGLRRLPARVLPRPIHFGAVPHPRLLPDPSALRWSTSWGDLDHI
jgi:Acetyltransferase (GNAT) domain